MDSGLSDNDVGRPRENGATPASTGRLGETTLRPATIVSGLSRLHRPLIAAAVFAALIAVIATVGYFTDDRTLVGAPIWHKAAKFGISIAIYTVTIAWMLQFLPRRSRIGRVLGTIIAIGISVELAFIVVQIIRGQMSHFNVRTPLDAGLYYGMGGLITVVWLANLVLGFVLAFRRLPDRGIAAGIRWGTAIGLIGMAIAFLMTVGELNVVDMDAAEAQGLAGAHSVGAVDGGPMMPITGWNTEAGDIRVPHFLGIHALQIIPFAALGLVLLGRRWPRLRPASVRVGLVRIVALFYLGVVALATVQALRGQSVAQTDGPMFAALSGLAVLAGVGALAVILRRGGSRVERVS